MAKMALVTWTGKGQSFSTAKYYFTQKRNFQKMPLEDAEYFKTRLDFLIKIIDIPDKEAVELTKKETPLTDIKIDSNVINIPDEDPDNEVDTDGIEDERDQNIDDKIANKVQNIEDEQDEDDLNNENKDNKKNKGKTFKKK